MGCVIPPLLYTPSSNPPLFFSYLERLNLRCDLPLSYPPSFSFLSLSTPRRSKVRHTGDEIVLGGERRGGVMRTVTVLMMTPKLPLEGGQGVKRKENGKCKGVNGGGWREKG